MVFFRLSLLCLSLVLVFESLNTRLRADSPIDLLQSANQLYEEGRFEEAQALYQSLVDQGLQDSLIFYNLGNTYFKLGHLGQAILNYRLAQNLNPRDADIRVNLDLARSQTIDQIEGNDETLASQWIGVTQRWLSLSELALMTLSLWFITALLFIAYTQQQQRRLRRWQKPCLYVLILSFVLFVSGILSLGGQLYAEKIRLQGVIVADEVNVTSGPGSQYIVEFALHSGAEIELLEKRNNWYRLTLPGGQLQGWVPASAIGIISPVK